MLFNQKLGGDTPKMKFEMHDTSHEAKDTNRVNKSQADKNHKNEKLEHPYMVLWYEISEISRR
jgi:hypothetical protein